MPKWVERIISNKYIQVASVCLISMILIGLFDCFFLLSVGMMISAELLSVVVDIFEILIIILAIIATISVSIMGVQIMIYGKIAKHDKTYWNGNKDTRIMETENNPYWLPVKYSNPILPFLIGFGCYITVICFICINYLHFEFSSRMPIVLLLLIEYVLIVAIVILIRLFRRFRAFQVKLMERI